MTHSRWSTVLRRVTTEGPYINERMSVLVLTVVVLAGVSAVAYADKSVAPVSLAPLYFLPLALSALVHPLRISLALSIVCLVLHDLVGSVRDVGTEHLLKDAITLLGYVFVVVVVNQLGAQRRRLAELAERQRDELANEIELAAEVQQGILPRSIPQVPGFDFAARMYPAKIVEVWLVKPPSPLAARQLGCLPHSFLNNGDQLLDEEGFFNKGRTCFT